MQTERKSIFSNPIVLIIVALLCNALWGSATPAIKTGYELLEIEGVASIMLFAGIRFTLAGIFTVIIFSIARRKFLFPKKENFTRVLTVSAFQTVIQYIFFYLGLAYTTGVKGTVTSGSGAFFAVIIASLIFKQEKLTVKKILACVIGFAGIVIINFNGLTFTDDPMDILGVVFVLLSTVSNSCSSVLIKKFSAHEDPVVISGYQFIVGGIFMVAVGLIAGGEIHVSNFGGVAILIYLALLSAVAYSLWGLLLKSNPVSRVTIFNFMTPVFGVLLTMLFLPSENSSVAPWNLVITLFLVCLGIFLLNYNPQKKEAEAEAIEEVKDK
ncbi:MAG: DMT family transporter [Clostridia bacterium]|nr:DMT family transporter [Clostridia bacterium]